MASLGIDHSYLYLHSTIQHVYFMQSMHQLNIEHLLKHPLDNHGNTIAHLAAQEGVISVFKVRYKTHCVIFS